MASTDAKPLPIKNQAYRVTFPIFDADGDLVPGAADLDSEVSKDGGTFVDCTNEATEIATSSGMYYLDLTSDEMNADTVAIIVKTSTSGAKTTPIVLYPVENTDIPVNVKAISDDTAAADNLETAADGGSYNLGGGGVVTASVTGAVGSVSGAVGSVTGNVGGNVTGSVGSLATQAKADVQAEAEEALRTYHLDHLAQAGSAPTPADGSYLDNVMNKDASQTFDPTTDSLEAIRDRGDAAWVTGGGGSISDILYVVPLIPMAIDLANTAAVRIGLGLTNMLDDLPSTAEITPGTITIDRKAIGGTSWTNVVNAATCSEVAGLIYYDEVFDSGTGYAAGDSIRITFKSQKITVGANDYEITGTDGWVFQTYIREAMRGTDSAALASVCTEGRLAELDAANLPADVDGIKAKTDNLAFTGGSVHAHTKATDDLDLTATQKASVNTEVDNGLDTAIPGSPTADSINERVKTMDNLHVYQAKLWVFDDETNSTDRYVCAFYKDGEPITSGITTPQIQVVKATDGTDLIAATALSQIGSTGLYKKDETTNRMVNGAAYMAKVTATIDGSTRTWYQPVGRDSSA